MRKLSATNAKPFFPGPPENLADLPDDPLCKGDVAEIARVYRRITQREPADGDIEQFGRYLFYSLIGPDNWNEIKKLAQGKALIELALTWSPENHDLHRLNWEMLHDGERFLMVEVPGTIVVISRIVPGSGQAEKLKVPPRVLFVLGTLVTDPQIRPGAEFLGLLRTLRAQGISLNYRLLENATPAHMRDAIASFQPDVVHFMCHGGVDPQDDKGFLELQTDDSNAISQRKIDQLLPYLKDADGRLPKIVVLSACYSASPGSTAMVQGPYLAAPLAAELVAGGVPVVLGMGGRVSDFACRLFTRGFGEAVLQGKSLARAAGVARIAAFAEGAPPRQKADWAFPTMFIANTVDEEYVPVDAGAANPLRQVEDWIVEYKVQDEPVFCGRNEFFQAYYDLFKQNDKPVSVLVASVEGPGSGYGKTRLLEELTVQALRDGHVPCLVRPKKPEMSGGVPGDLPKNALDLGVIIMQAINTARTGLDLEPRVYSEIYKLLQLTEPFSESVSKSELDNRIKAVLGLASAITPPAIRLAIQIELQELVKDARAAHEHIRRVQGRAIVLLDDVDSYGEAIDDLGAMLTKSGLGTAAEPAPVVIACSKTGPAADKLKPITGQAMSWLKELRLEAFSEKNEEDLLAYNWILLNPYGTETQVDEPNKPLVINDLAKANVVAAVKEFFRERFKGIPGAMAEAQNFYGFTRVTFNSELTKEFYMPADDEDFMDKWRKANTWAKL
jgi:hypothetical protein